MSTNRQLGHARHLNRNLHILSIILVGANLLPSSTNTHDIDPVLIKAIQEQNQRIEKLDRDKCQTKVRLREVLNRLKPRDSLGK